MVRNWLDSLPGEKVRLGEHGQKLDAGKSRKDEGGFSKSEAILDKPDATHW